MVMRISMRQQLLDEEKVALTDRDSAPEQQGTEGGHSEFPTKHQGGAKT